jgi:hypothetical protein
MPLSAIAILIADEASLLRYFVPEPGMFEIRPEEEYSEMADEFVRRLS